MSSGLGLGLDLGLEEEFLEVDILWNLGLTSFCFFWKFAQNLKLNNAKPFAISSKKHETKSKKKIWLKFRP